MADTLAGAGIASLRTDKRGIGASAAAAPAEVDMRLSTYVDDAAAWATWLKGQPGVKCVVLAGHSEGVLIALLAAQKVSVCGVVSLEGAGRSLAEVLKDQLQHGLQEPLRAQALAAVDQLAAGKTVVDPPPQLASMFRPSVQPYMISELSVDPAAEARKLRGPLLLVQGDRDQQVTLVDFERLKAVRPDAATLLVPGMIHPLKVVAPVPGQTVNLTNLPLAPGVGETVVKFVKGL
ncbi:MAG: alpha/beta hydrolase [Caulobacteraceae bacterium]